MYTFPLKENKTSFGVALVKTVLAIDATIAFLQISRTGLAGLMIGIILIVLIFYTAEVSKKIPVIILLGGGILALCLLTGSSYFILILVLYWFLNKMLDRESLIEISDSSIKIIKPVSLKNYKWDEVEYIVLKDGLLTIQFLNNRYIQQEVNLKTDQYTENEFNNYCDKMVTNRN